MPAFNRRNYYAAQPPCYQNSNQPEQQQGANDSFNIPGQNTRAMQGNFLNDTFLMQPQVPNSLPKQKPQQQGPGLLERLFKPNPQNLEQMISQAKGKPVIIHTVTTPNSAPSSFKGVVDNVLGDVVVLKSLENGGNVAIRLELISYVEFIPNLLNSSQMSSPMTNVNYSQYGGYNSVPSQPYSNMSSSPAMPYSPTMTYMSNPMMSYPSPMPHMAMPGQPMSPYTPTNYPTSENKSTYQPQNFSSNESKPSSMDTPLSSFTKRSFSDIQNQPSYDKMFNVEQSLVSKDANPMASNYQPSFSKSKKFSNSKPDVEQILNSFSID